MNEQEALAVFKALVDDNDTDWEVIHIEADKLLCALLEKDYPNLVAQYKALPKWYA